MPITRGLDDEERRMWILNDEGLYSWWNSSGMAMKKFIRAHREELDKAINRMLTKRPRGRSESSLDDNSYFI